MDNNNHNENLSPQELVEKLKEKLAMDRDTFSEIVNNTEQESISDSQTLGEQAELESYEEVVAEVDDSSEEYGIVDEIEEIEDIEEIEEIDEIEDFEEIEDDVAFNMVDSDENNGEVVSAEIVDESVINSDEGSFVSLDEDDAEQTKIINSLDSQSNIDLNQTIANLFADFDELEDDEPITAEIDAIKEDLVDQTVVMGAFDSATVTDSATIKKPTVYRFRRYDPNEAQMTKVSTVVLDNEDENSDDDAQATRVCDIPELEKPDLKVMQTFGASVEHVRELYGDDVADEYEQTLLQSNLGERDVVENEYVSFAQNDNVIDRFKKKLAKLKGKIIISGAMCVLLLLLENLSLVGVKLGGMFNSEIYTVSYIMICLQLLLICGAVAFKTLKSGVTDLIAFEPSYKSLTFVMLCVSVVTDIISCFVPGPVILYNFCSAVAIFMLLVYEYNMAKRDYMSFKIISNDKAKTAAIISIGTSKTPEVAAYEQLDEDEEVKIISLQKGNFINDFFARIKQTDSTPQDKILIPLTLSCMVVLFVLTLVLHGDYSSALRIANMSFSAFAPFAVYFSFVLPLSKATTSVYENGSAIIGTAALEEYSGASIIAFEDKDIFPSYCVKLKSVKVYGDSRIDKILYNASSVFSQVGGPLSDVFSLATIEIGISEDVQITSCSHDGIEATVDGKRILIGKESFLTEYGIFARNDETDDDNYARLYVAEDDFLCAKFYVKYSLDVDFENVISRMAASGICGVLKTYDPNIDDELLRKFIDTKKYPVKVVKCKLGEDISHVQDQLNSGVISISGSKNTVDATVTCERLCNIRASSNTVKMLAMIIGMILCSFIALFKITPFCSAIVVLYQLLWTIPNIISTKLYINR